MSLSKTRSQLVGRQQVNTSVDAPGLVVAARPIRFATPKVNVDKRGAAGLADTARALSSFLPTINGMVRKQKAEHDQNEFIAGQQIRAEAGVLTIAGHQAHMLDNDINKNSSRARGYMASAGRANGYKDLEDWNEWIADNGETIVTDEQYNAAQAKFYADRLKGMEDPDFVSNYLGVQENNEHKSRTRWSQDSYMRVQQETAHNTNVGMRGDIATAVEAEGSLEQIHELAQVHRNQAALNGLAKTETIDMYIDNIEDAAMASGRMELVGTEPGKFGVFELEQEDVNNPGQMMPSIASNPKYHDRLADMQRRVLRATAVKVTKVSDAAKFKQQAVILDHVAQGDYAKARQRLEANVEGGTYSYSQATALSNKIDKAEEKQEKVELNHALYSGDTTGSMTPKERQEEADHWSVTSVEGIEDPHELRATLGMNRTKEVKNGVFNSQAKTLMRTSDPALSPQDFLTSVDEFVEYRAINPETTMNQIGKDRYMMYESYLQAQRAGLSKVNAMEHVKRMTSPLFREQAKAITKGPRGKAMIAQIEERLIDSQVDGLDVTNAPYVKRTVMENASVYAAMNPGAEEEAVEFGITAYKARHHTVVNADGKARSIDMKGRTLPEGYTDTEKLFSDEFAASKGSDSTYYFMPDPLQPTSDLMMVMNDTTGMPEHEMNAFGELEVMMVDPRKLNDQRIASVRSDDLARAKEKALAYNVAKQRRRANAQKGKDALEPINRAIGDVIGGTVDAVSDAGEVVVDTVLDQLPENFKNLFKPPRK